jgi:RNA polymerase sigma factor (sigma-70 family)
MIPLNSSEQGTVPSQVSAAESPPYVFGLTADHVRASPVNPHLFALAQTYLREHRLGHKTGPSLEAAWWTFFESLVPLIRAYARICRCSASNLDDSMQEVCIVLILHLPNYHHDVARGRFHDWLFVVVRRTLTKMRKRDKRFQLDKLSREESDRHVGREDDPAASFERLERAQRIHDALGDFHAEVDFIAFRIVDLHWIEGLSIKEVARELRVSPGRVRGCLTRMKKKLRGCFEHQGIAASQK